MHKSSAAIVDNGKSVIMVDSEITPQRQSGIHLTNPTSAYNPTVQ